MIKPHLKILRPRFEISFSFFIYFLFYISNDIYYVNRLFTTHKNDHGVT